MSPTIIKKYIQNFKTSYNFNFLDDFKAHLDSEIYYDYLKCMDPYLLNNLWNRIIERWNRMRLELWDNEEFITSIYFENEEYLKIYKPISYQDFNHNVSKFISGNSCKCIFVLNVLHKYINPFLK